MLSWERWKKTAKVSLPSKKLSVSHAAGSVPEDGMQKVKPQWSSTCSFVWLVLPQTRTLSFQAELRCTQEPPSPCIAHQQPHFSAWSQCTVYGVKQLDLSPIESQKATLLQDSDWTSVMTCFLVNLWEGVTLDLCQAPQHRQIVVRWREI